MVKNKFYRNNINTVKEIFQFDKCRVLMEILNILFSLINLFIPIVLMKNVLDCLAYGREMREFISWLSAYVILSLLNKIFAHISNSIYYPRANIKIEEKYKKEVMKKMKSTDLEQQEDTEFLDKYSWIFGDIGRRVISVWDNSWLLISTLTGLTYLIATTSLYDPIIIVFVVLQLFVTYYSNKKINMQEYCYKEKTILDTRRQEYIKRILYLPQYAKEIRLYDIKDVLESKYSMAINSLSKKTKQFVQKTFLVRLMSNVGAIFGFLGIVYIGVKALVWKRYSVGDIYAIYLIMINMTSKTQQLIYCFTEMKKHSLYIENYNSFLAYKPKIKENLEGISARKCANEIEIRDVSFGYEHKGEKKLVLKKIDMHIKAGEKIAIVGHNGAGKSTLIKLIMRLYLPDTGDVYLDGEKADRYNLHSYRQRFGTIFQDFQMYAFSIGENVIMDNLKGSEEEESRIWSSLEHSGLSDKIRKYPWKLETMVSKEFEDDGVNLSGGEAQKLAIARIFAHDYGVLIMDEPSSNLDPVSEHELFRNMMEAAENKTVIIISHRLSATVNADRIYLMEDGRIIEQGTHKELMDSNGKYAEMFRIQADNYITGVM